MEPDQPPDGNPTPRRPSGEEPATEVGGQPGPFSGKSPETPPEDEDTRDAPAAPDNDKTDRPPAWRKIPGIGRMRTAGRAFGASVGVIAAVASVMVGYLAIPKNISSEDWGQRVNAICEKSAAELRDPLRNAAEGLASLNALLEDPSNVRAVPADLTTTAYDIQDTADSYRLVIGQIREIDRPDDTTKIDVLLDAGSDLYRSLDSISSGLLSTSNTVALLLVNPGDVALQSSAMDELTTLSMSVQNVGATALPAYQTAITDLELEQCEL